MISDHIRFVLIPTNILYRLRYFCEIRRRADRFERASGVPATIPSGGRLIELLSFIQRLNGQKAGRILGGHLTFAFCG